jgi:hypothetical protein
VPLTYFHKKTDLKAPSYSPQIVNLDTYVSFQYVINRAVYFPLLKIMNSAIMSSTCWENRSSDINC